MLGVLVLRSREFEFGGKPSGSAEPGTGPLGQHSAMRAERRGPTLRAASSLDLARERVVDSYRRGTRLGNAHLLGAQSRTWPRPHSSRLSVYADVTPPHVEAAIHEGTRMHGSGRRSDAVWDRAAIDPAVTVLLAAVQNAGTHGNRSDFIGFAPISMEIIDHQIVLLEGPVVKGECTVLCTQEAMCLTAAHTYWDAVLAASQPCLLGGEPAAGLTERQLRVVGLMLAHSNDQQIADRLEVSIRTVRTEIATILSVLDVGSRFAAGFMLRAALDIRPPGVGLDRGLLSVQDFPA